MTKDELIDALEDEREKFLDAIEGLPEEAFTEPGVSGNWSVKDILAHISSWEAELVRLLFQARQGDKPTSVHFSGESDDQINARWSEAYAARPLDRVLDDFAGVRKQTIRRVEAFADTELNNGQFAPWLKGTPLWKWIASSSFEHEAEHAGQIQTWRTQRGI